MKYHEVVSYDGLLASDSALVLLDAVLLPEYGLLRLAPIIAIMTDFLLPRRLCLLSFALSLRRWLRYKALLLA